MRTGNVLLIALLATIFMSVAHLKLMTTRSATVTAFGEGTGRRANEIRYYEQAFQALDCYLLSNHFSRIQRHSAEPEATWNETWYANNGDRSQDVVVLVRRPVKGEAGLGAYIVTNWQGYSWRSGTIETQAQSLVAELANWWSRYREDHPRLGEQRTP